MSNKGLKLNSLSRYSKQSPRLVLEEHGHCEVPAGCGGVVLRWRNPHESIPIEMWFHTNGEVEFFLDGEQPSSSQPLVTYGEHILAFRIPSQVLPRKGLLMFAGFYDEKEMTGVNFIGGSRNPIYILSEPDGTWKYSLTEPGDDLWLYPEFDDSDWMPMVLKPLSLPGKRDIGHYRFTRLKKIGAKGLGIGEINIGKTIWIRKSFSLSKGD